MWVFEHEPEWRSENDLWQWVPPFTVGSRDRIQATGLTQLMLLLIDASYLL